MLGSKITNLTTLTNNNINVPKFTIITFNELITNIEELNNIIEQNENKSIKQQSKILKQYIKDNINKNIIVPMSLVDTYHVDNIHPAELLNIVFFNSMIQNGIKVVKEII